MAKVALLIGVSDYEPGLNPLPAAVKDVEAMKRVLAHPEMGGFGEADITVLKNPQRQEMEDAIYRLFSNRQKDDLLLFFFSGHGVKDESGKLYLSTRTTHKENGKLVKPSAVAASFLHESMNESKSQRQVVILDCCFSGAFAQGMTAKDDGSVDLEEYLGGKGRAILTATTSTQYAFEEEDSELAVYTRYLVEGIEKGAADTDGDGWISVDELHEYASSKVQEAAPAMTPKFYPVEEGHKILLAKASIEDPRLKYRKEVEAIARECNGEISGVDGIYLNELISSLGLNPEEASAIEGEVLKPLREFKNKLGRYEEVIRLAVKQEYPLSERTETMLAKVQNLLKLRDEDVAPIKTRIIAQLEAEKLGKQQQSAAPRKANLGSKASDFSPQQKDDQSKNKLLVGLSVAVLGLVVYLIYGQFYAPSRQPPTSLPTSQTPSQTQPHVKPEIPNNKLKSEQGIDYARLQNSLRAGNWQEANQLTSTLMLKLANREQQGYLVHDDIKNLPCQDIRTINQLWVYYSNGHFGFSKQARIWQDIGGKNYEDSIRFEALVGWQGRKLILDPKSAPVGHLPLRPAGTDGIMDAWGGGWIDQMPLRLESCGINIGQ